MSKNSDHLYDSIFKSHKLEKSLQETSNPTKPPKNIKRLTKLGKEKRIKTTIPKHNSEYEDENSNDECNEIQVPFNKKYKVSDDDNNQSNDNIVFIDNNCSDLSVTNSVIKEVNNTRANDKQNKINMLDEIRDGSPPISNASPEIRKNTNKAMRHNHLMYQTRKSLDSNHFKSHFKNNVNESRDDSHVNLFPKILAPSIEFSNFKSVRNSDSPGVLFFNDERTSAYNDIFGNTKNNEGNNNYMAGYSDIETTKHLDNLNASIQKAHVKVDYQLISTGPEVHHIAIDGTLYSESQIRVAFSQLQEANAYLHNEINGYIAEIAEQERINEELTTALNEEKQYIKYTEGLYKEKRSLEQLRSVELNRMKKETDDLKQIIGEKDNYYMLIINKSNESLQKISSEIMSYDKEIALLNQTIEKSMVVESAAKKRLYEMETNYSALCEDYQALRNLKSEHEEHIDMLQVDINDKTQKIVDMDNSNKEQNEIISKLRIELSRYKELISRQNTKIPLTSNNNDDIIEVFESKIETLTREKRELLEQLKKQQLNVETVKVIDCTPPQTLITDQQSFVSKILYDKSTQILKTDFSPITQTSQSLQCDILSEIYTDHITSIKKSHHLKELTVYYEIKDIVDKMLNAGAVDNILEHLNLYIFPLLHQLAVKAVDLYHKELNFDSELKSVNTKNLSLDERVDKLIQHMEAKKRENEILEQKLEEQEKKMIAIKNLHDLAKKQKKLNKKLTIQNTITLSMPRSADKDHVCESNTDLIASLTEEIISYKTNQIDSTALQKEKESKIQTLTKLIQSKDDSIEKFHNTIKTMETQLLQTEKDRKALLDTITQLETKVKNYADKITTLKHKRQEEKLVIQKLTMEYKKLLNEVRNKVESTVNTSNIASDNKCLEDLNKVLQQKIKVLGDEVKTLKKESNKPQTHKFLFEILGPRETIELFKRFMMKIAYSHEMMREIKDCQEFILFHNNITAM